MGTSVGGVLDDFGVRDGGGVGGGSDQDAFRSGVPVAISVAGVAQFLKTFVLLLNHSNNYSYHWWEWRTFSIYSSLLVRMLYLTSSVLWRANFLYCSRMVSYYLIAFSIISSVIFF